MTDVTQSRMGPFQPCDISDVFDESTPGVFTPRFGAAYQILDGNKNFQIAWGSPAIWYGKYVEGCVQKMQGSPGAAYAADSLYYAVMFPAGITIVSDITYPTLHKVISSARDDDPVARALRDYFAERPNDPILHEVRQGTERVYQSSELRILILRKDRIINGEIERDTPRPLQMAPGVYLDI